MKLFLYALEVVGEIIGGVAAATIFVAVKSAQFGFEVGDRIDAWIDRTAEAIKSECPNCGPKGKGRWKVLWIIRLAPNPIHRIPLTPLFNLILWLFCSLVGLL